MVARMAAVDPFSQADSLVSRSPRGVGEPAVSEVSSWVDGAAAVEHAQSLASAVGLTELEAAILDFEREWWRFSGAKEQSIRERFDLTPAHYHQVLGALLDDARALAYDPILVKRLTRLRHARHQARTARRSVG